MKCKHVPSQILMGTSVFTIPGTRGRLQKPVLCAGPRFSPVTMNEGPLPEAQNLNDFPWTVENLVVPTAVRK